jgi:hypothetical protein
MRHSSSVELLFYRPRGDQHLRHKDLVALEAVADDYHAGNKTVFQNRANTFVGIQSLPHETVSVFAPSVDHGLRERMLIRHHRAILARRES